ncbi:MAG: peptidylprolyl isomerase [Alphaproteobacteria bacterium]|nr:peptidylprolyl isomerase [Alphaproteobacteria bacterium]
MMIFKLLTVVFCLFITLPVHAEDTRIVVVVNDEAITNADVEDRMGLIFLSSGLERNEANSKSVRERVIKNLIEEKLQTQEAKHSGIDATNAEVETAIASIAKQNRMTADDMTAMLAQGNVPKQTLVDQIKATLMWTRVIQRQLRPQVEVGDDEVSAVLERIKANEGKPEYLMAEIFLNVDNPADEPKVQELAMSLIERMKNGTPFNVIAQQFSKGTGALNGGDLGWIQPGQLGGDMDKAAQAIAVGNVSPPIRMPDGFHILAKKQERIISAVDPRAIEVHMRQANFALQGRTMASVQGEIDRFRQSVASCSALTSRIGQYQDWTTADLGEKRIGELPPWLAKLAQSLPLNEPSTAMEKNGYAILLYVCERNDSGADRNTILASLGNEKLELQARRLLRDLQRSASIEMRE